MKNVPNALIAWMQARKPSYPVDLFNFAFADGTSLNLCSFASNITYQGVTYTGTGVPICTRTGWEIKNTPEVPTMDITLLSTGTDYGSVNIKRAIINGLLDGCVMTLNRVYLNPQTWAQIGGILIFEGVTGPVQINLSGAKITFRGRNIKMDQNYPKNIYQTGCIWSLYGPGCLVNRSEFTFSGTVAAATTNYNVNWTSDPSNGKFANFGLGYMSFTSGACDGQTRTVQTALASGVTLMYPYDSVPQPGDTFEIAFGCTKTLSYCKSVFANQQRWRGFPYIPPAETAL